MSSNDSRDTFYEICSRIAAIQQPLVTANDICKFGVSSEQNLSPETYSALKKDMLTHLKNASALLNGAIQDAERAGGER